MKTCFLCSNANTKGGMYFSSSFVDLDFIFIAQNPGKSWYSKPVVPEDIIPFGLDKPSSYNRFFTLLSNKFFEKHARKINFYITNVAKCSTIDNSLLPENIETCPKEFLYREISVLKKYSPNVRVVTLGKSAFELNFDFNTIALHHPGYMNRQPSEVMYDDVMHLVEI